MRHELEWMREVSAAAVQQKEIDFKTFRKNFFSKARKTKIQRCQYKGKYDKQSFRLPNQKFDLEESTIRLEKIGRVQVVIDRRPPEGCKYMSATITKDKVGSYFASVLVEEHITPRFEPTGKAVGIDLGLKHFVTLSTGEKIENPRWFRESQAELRKAQQNLSRKKKGSTRYRKCKLKVARIHQKTSNQRRWFHHQVSLDLVRRFDFIGMEDLNVAGMKKNRSLAKSVSDAGLGQFVSFLRYKSDWNRKVVQEVDRFFPSSKMCGDCGAINHDLKLEDREWVCVSCGCLHDRDGNASRNIEVEALRIYAAQGVACA
jgi:putative transposase